MDVRVAIERCLERRRQPRVEPLQVEHHPGGGRRCAEQRQEVEDRSAGAAEPPPVPVDAHGADRLQVTHLQTAPEKVDVGLDGVDAQRLGRPQRGEVVTGSMREDERGLRTGVRAGAGGGLWDHVLQCRRRSLASPNQPAAGGPT